MLYELSERFMEGWGPNFSDAEYAYRKDLGLTEIVSFAPNNDRTPSGLEGVLLKGYPSEVFDMIEASLESLGPADRNLCQSHLNQYLREYKVPWLLYDGRFSKLDSEYLSSEVATRARHLLADTGFDGPLEEFDTAIEAYASGQFRDAITYANHALESTIKAVFPEGRGKPIALTRGLIDSGLVPKYYDGFFKALESVIGVVGVERSQPGRGHGQGASPESVEPSLAEFALHLTGTTIVFIIKRYREHAELSVVPPVAESEERTPDDLPF